MENTPQSSSHALALLKLMGNQEGAGGGNPPLGWALHLETRSSVYNLAAHRLLQTLIEHSPSPEEVAQQFMMELAQCENSVVIDLVDSLNNDRPVSPANWAAAVYEGLSQSENISALTNLAVFYLNNLVIPFRNPGGNTPQESDPPSPNPIRTEQIKVLLESADVGHDQAALKELVRRRDGPSCPVTGAPFIGDHAVMPQCSHIIPFSIHNKTSVHLAIEMFTGYKVTANVIRSLINNPANAINVQFDAHHAMDKRLAWGIEARLVDNKWKYYFRAVKKAIPLYIKGFVDDGGEIFFGGGPEGETIAWPDPRLCNLHLAVARVFAASGFAEVVDQIYKDNEGNASTGFAEELSHKLLEVSVLS